MFDFVRGSQLGGGFYGYRLKFWLFYGYRLIFFQLRLTKKLKINFFCFKDLNVEPVSLKQNTGLRSSRDEMLSFWKILAFDRLYFL